MCGKMCIIWNTFSDHLLRRGLYTVLKCVYYSNLSLELLDDKLLLHPHTYLSPYENSTEWGGNTSNGLGFGYCPASHLQPTSCNLHSDCSTSSCSSIRTETRHCSSSWKS